MDYRDICLISAEVALGGLALAGIGREHYRYDIGSFVEYQSIE